MMEIELSASQARELTDRIKLAVEATWELIKEAYQSRAWYSLGYTSWDDYCTREFGTSRIKLPREERQEVVSSMREIGMSTRAIASATGSSVGTVHAELSRRSELNTSNAQPVTGTDGKTYTQKPRPEPETPEWEEVGTIPQSRLKDIARPTATTIPQSELDELNTPSPLVGPGEKIPETSHTTKGIPETEEPTPRAEPITTQLSKAIIELNKAMNRIHRIVEDPNFHRNKQTAWSLHGNDIIRTIDELETIVNNMK